MSCLILLLVALLSVARGAERQLPLDERPNQLHADDLDRFYLDFGNRVIRWTDREDRVFTWPAPDGWSTSDITHGVAPPTGVIHSLQTVSKSRCVDKDCQRKITDYKLRRWTCSADGDCSVKNLASWSRRSGEKSSTRYSSALRVTEKGTPLVAVTRIKSGSSGTDRKTTWTCGERACDAKSWVDTWYGEMATPPSYRVAAGLQGFIGPGLVPPRKGVGGELLEVMANVDRHELYDRAGGAHIFFHRSADRSFAQMSVSEGASGPKVVTRSLDGAESGASSAVVRLGDGLLTVHYFFRNSYYKGVKATYLPDAAGAPAWQIDLDSSADDNPGWQLQAAATLQGRVLVGYSSDPKAKDRSYVLRLFDSKEDVRAAARPQPEGWEVKRKRITGMVGAGLTRASWLLKSPTPPSEDFDGLAEPDALRVDASYRVSPSILGEVTGQARVGRVSLGASYARQVIKGALDDAGLPSGQIDRVYGMLGIDCIVKYHDLRFQLRQGQMQTIYDVAPIDRESGFLAPQSGVLDATYRRTDLFLLNTWRVRYGVMRQRYPMVLPIYAWNIQSGSKTYQYAGSGIREAEVVDTALTVGFSRLDYAAKYENDVSKIFLDLDGGIGMSKATWSEPLVVLDDDGESTREETDATAVLLPFNAELGYLLLKRAKALRGLGFWLRLGVRAEGSVAGVAGHAGEKDEAAEEDSTRLGYNRTEVRAGPFLQSGLVF